jgi:uncharacterized repeat protein (TIGR01451 family)
MPTREIQLRKDSQLFAQLCLALLREGHSVQFRVQGESMRPNILDGDAVLVAPAADHELCQGDIALVQNQDGLRVHRVASCDAISGAVVTRSDTGLGSDPAASRLFGKVIVLRRNSREESLTPLRTRFVHPLRIMFRRMRAAARLRLRRVALLLTGIVALSLLCATFLAPAALAQADLSLAQTAAPLVVAPAANITYTESVTNNGPNDGVTVVLYQQTPPNTTFVSITAPAGWTCGTPAVGATGQVTCTDGANLTNGSVANFTYVVQVNGVTAAGTTIVNSANVTSTTADGAPQNNASATTVLVESSTGADLALTMSASPSPVFVSANLTYTIQVTNQGLASANNVVVSDTIPAGTTFVSAAPSPACTQAANVVCTLGTLANGASTSITIVVTSPVTASTLSNTANVTSTPNIDPVAGNNSATVITVAQPLSCATPGRDGLGTAITGTVNTYYPPAGASTTLSAGSNSVALGAHRGANTAIAIGDLVLIIQMQDATINSTNSSSYGDGMPGDPATGSQFLNSSGEYEFVTASSNVPIGGGTLTFIGIGPGNGALNTYTQAAFGANGQKTFQVIRVPQYTNVTLGAALTAAAWNGATGGVLALDVASQLNLNGQTVSASNLGFRGGAGRQLTGAAGAATDYITLATSAKNGSKGEGIAGTPRYVPNAAFTAVTNSGVEGYPNGSYARGAPGNAGGGATDANPPANNQNSGGGGGGNGGNGGYGGYGWNSAGIVGGHFGSAFPASTSALILGGGGGAGTTNDGTADPANTNPAGINSSGSAGGGIVLIRSGSLVGTGTLSANGQNALNVQNDGAGGGGAGGSILVFTNSGGLTGLTVTANGGNGGNTWATSGPGTPFPGNRHGPGGGGGGGAVLLSPAPMAVSVAGGTNGFSTTAQDAYGATVGQSGVYIPNLTITQTPGTQSGAYCASADLSVTNSGSPPVVLPGGNITYTQVATNNSNAFDAVNAVFSESIPANTTFQSINSVAGWTCVTPAVGGTGTISCTNPDFANGGAASFTVVVQVGGSVVGGAQIIDVDSITSGTSDPNLANNTATAITTVAVAFQADLAVINTASSPTVTAGSNVTMTAKVTNNGPAAAAAAVFTETLPGDTTLGAAFTPPSGWTCNTIPVGGTGTFTCTDNSFAALASSTFTIVLNVTSGTPSGTLISDTANISAFTSDPNYGNNSATATTIVAAPGQADLAVSSSATPNPVTAGNNITYTQSITNNGPTAITASATTTVTFTDAIPANTTLGATFTAPTGWTCNTIAVGGTGTFTCTLNSGQTLAIGAIVNFPLVVKVNLTTAPGTTITNSPSIASTVGDPNLGNNSVTVSTIVALPTQSSVRITKTASPEPVNQGAILTYLVTVTNGGPAVATGTFTVTDVLPPEVTYIPNSYSTTNGTCSGTTTVTCTLSNLAVGSTAVITINVTASTFSANSLSTNTAELTTTSLVSNLPTSLGTATNATWAGNIATFTFPIPLPLGVNSLLTTTGFAPTGYNVTNAPVLSVNAATGVVTVALATNPGTSTAMGAGTTNYPLYANAISTIQAPTAVDMSSFRVFSQSDGSVILEWRTHEESRNIGFHIYREDASGRTRLDPSLIAGSALLLRGGRPQHAAKVYRWIDPHPVRDGAYWIEDVDINGTRSTHGPAYVESPSAEVAATLASAPSSALLSSQRASSVSPSSANPSPALTVPRPILPVLPSGLPRLIIADHQAVKISVAQEGWYHVSFAQLFAAGLDRYTDSRTLHLYAEGVEQPLLLTGRASGFPSPSDAIEFYGTGIDTPFSADRVYWLISDSHWPKRILPVAAPVSGSIAPASFPFTVLREDRTTYFAALLNGENSDNFFGAVITSEATDQDLAVAHIDSSSALPISLDVALQGVTDAQEHRVTVQFNGATLGEMDFLGLALAEQSFPVELSSLQNGTNTVTLTALNGDNDVSLVQSIALHYAHTYAADADWLRATAFAGSELHLTGFTNPQVRAFDITDSLNISELAAKISRESGAYSAVLALSTGGPAVRTILAFANDAISAPVSLTPHVPTFLDDNRTGADVVIITHPDFVTSLLPLVRLRESQGHHIALVTTDQIFDEYNYGERSPFAIRSFLQEAASRWQRKPQSILFVGDASFDPRDYLGLGDFDFVPTRIIETAAFKTVSDDWFTDFAQNGFATIPTGRLPVRTSADADLVVSKIIGYEGGSSAGSWNSQALLIADQNVETNFTAAANSAAATLPSTLQVSEILADSLDSATARSQILAALNNGALLVDYNGHGAEQQWSFADLFDSTDAAALSNGGRLPVYLLMDCLNGFFHDVYAESLAESLLLAPNGGAVAVWASSGFTQQSPQSTMNQAFLHLFAGNPNQSLGRLVLQAKAGTTDNDVRRTWILFGDPAMKLQFAPTAIPARTSTLKFQPVTTPVSARPCLPVSVCSKEKQRQ